ncbi:MAG: SGNH/GDSL hydrolase family protein [Nonomuraea sp.]|nr:SGNH/GDSL hydrolase family protein [Nonomuraea sp.]NUP69327.1 SGNH/GDSL hydrolase family protein [Nonomuraea sp.]NUP80166.1 SGNH/GDSL hydrolase family protein [Nonomuraea sp.]NUR89596.1 SGNH/GDSL hydrolase family protein [Nonomuraea sp.]NUS06391.1 SGNH/GDSL hydrolase family protein [Nonomuraea sp.]
MIGRLCPVVTAVLVLAASGPAQAVAAAQPVPETMAALGDSISTGFNSCGWYVSCGSRSWAAGDNTQVSSHYLRLRRLAGTLQRENYAVPGATSADLLGQVEKAIAAKADYVTILIGAQDACKRTEREMTPVSVYRQRLDAALGALRAGMPLARVFVASVPDLRRLWQVGKDSPIARTFWTIGKICQTMLADPASTKKADDERRARVRARVMAYNREAAGACAAMGPACDTDEGAIFSFPFTLDHVSKWDFFHPNLSGQRALAEQTFKHGFSWIDPR